VNRASRAIADSDAALGVAKLVVPLPPLTFALASHNGHCAARRVGEEGGDALTPFAALETLLKQRARSRAGPPATGHRQDSCGIVELRGKGSQEHVGSEGAQEGGFMQIIRGRGREPIGRGIEMKRPFPVIREAASGFQVDLLQTIVIEALDSKAMESGHPCGRSVFTRTKG